MTNKVPDVGDSVKYEKPIGPWTGKTFIVGYSSPILVVLFSLPAFEGMVMVSDPADFKYLSVVKEGRGILEQEHKEALTKAMEHWPYRNFFSSLDKTMVALRKMSGYESEKKVYINISGMVSEPLAASWKQVMAMADIYGQATPNSPDTEKLMLEWMLLAAMGMVNNYSDFQKQVDQD